MTKAELVEAVREGAGIGKGQAEEAVEAFLGAISKCLKKGDKLTLTGFGTFSVSNRKARTGRNTQTLDLSCNLTDQSENDAIATRYGE